MIPLTFFALFSQSAIVLSQAQLPLSTTFWRPAAAGLPLFAIRPVDQTLAVFVGGQLSGVLDRSPDGYEGLLHFPQTDACAPDGVTVQIRLISSQVAELQLSGQTACQLRKEGSADSVTRFRLLRTSDQDTAISNELGMTDALSQVWRNTSDNRLYRFRFDSDHLTIYQMHTSLIVADLALKRDKNDPKKDKYVGHTSLSRCHNGEMEIQISSPTRFEARIEIPDASNSCNQIGGAMRLGSLFKSWSNTSFIAEVRDP